MSVKNIQVQCITLQTIKTCQSNSFQYACLKIVFNNFSSKPRHTSLAVTQSIPLKVVTVFIRLNAAAFIKVLAFPMRRLFKGGVYFEITFFKIIENSYCKSFVNIMYLKGSSVSLILLRQNRKCLGGVNYQVVPSFFLLSSSKRRILLMRCGVYSRAAFNRINTVHVKLFMPSTQELPF